MSDNLIAVANATGFPLQSALEAVARNRENEHCWWFHSREKLWSEPGVASGFIDLVLGGQRYTSERDVCRVRLVIECKRLEGPLVFLKPLPVVAALPGYARFFCSRPKATPPSAWLNCMFRPAEQTVEFCAPGIRKGQRLDQPTSRMLEPWCSDLLRAARALGMEERQQLLSARAEIAGAIYIPVIVTTATLHLLSFPSSDVDLATGRVPAPPSSTVADVDWVHFYKDFGLQHPGVDPMTPEELEKQPHQSVVVVRATAFDRFLDAANEIRISLHGV